jgi:hypothetical protein
MKHVKLTAKERKRADGPYTVVVRPARKQGGYFVQTVEVATGAELPVARKQLVETKAQVAAAVHDQLRWLDKMGYDSPMAYASRHRRKPKEEPVKKPRKNSRRRVRKNPDGPNWLLIGGVAVGGYFAWKWWSGRGASSVQQPTSILAPATTANTQVLKAPVAPPVFAPPPPVVTPSLPQLPAPASTQSAPDTDTKYSADPADFEALDAEAASKAGSRGAAGLGNYYQG